MCQRACGSVYGSGGNDSYKSAIVWCGCSRVSIFTSATDYWKQQTVPSQSDVYKATTSVIQCLNANADFNAGPCQQFLNAAVTRSWQRGLLYLVGSVVLLLVVAACGSMGVLPGINATFARENAEPSNVDSGRRLPIVAAAHLARGGWQKRTVMCGCALIFATDNCSVNVMSGPVHQQWQCIFCCLA